MAMKEVEMGSTRFPGMQDDQYFDEKESGYSGGNGAVGGSMIGGNTPPTSEGNISLLGGQRTSDDTGGEGRTIWCGCLSVEFYQQFFDINTEDVLKRWKQSVISCKREQGFLELVGENPDAYGPFWNATSLVFLIALTTNITSGDYDFTKLVTSTYLVYGFAVAVPILLWITLNQIGVNLSLIKLVCMYGYSLGAFIPAVILCIIPSFYVVLMVLVGAGILSVVFLLRSLTPLLVERNMALAAPVMGALGVTQALLVLLLKIMFYAHV